MDEWAWLFEEGGQLQWQVIIPDLAVIGRLVSREGGGHAGFVVLEPETGDQATGTNLLELLQQVCTRCNDWPGLLERLKQEKAEDPLDRLEAVAANLDARAATGMMNSTLREDAARIRAAIRRLRSLPRRARITDAQSNRAAHALVDALMLPPEDAPAIAALLRQVLG